MKGLSRGRKSRWLRRFFTYFISLIACVGLGFGIIYLMGMAEREHPSYPAAVASPMEEGAEQADPTEPPALPTEGVQTPEPSAQPSPEIEEEPTAATLPPEGEEPPAPMPTPDPTESPTDPPEPGDDADLPSEIVAADPTISRASATIPENADQLVDDDPTALRLAGVKIGIDPGHQAKGNNEKEPIVPGSSETKPKVSSGTAGVSTRVAEHIVNLDVSIKLREALQAEGAEVFMTRETADVDISNVERAEMMNEMGVDLVLRIHCNGSGNKSANGIGLYIRATGENAEECLRAAEALMPEMVAATGAREDGIFKRDTYSGLNWSTVPSILVEMGFMSNAREDELLNSPEYQDKLVAGMVEGIASYCLSGPEIPEEVESLPEELGDEVGE